MGKKVIKLTESQLRDIVQKVIDEKVLSEQTINEDTTTGLGYGDALVNPSVDPKTQERINNLANILSSVKNGVIVNPSSKHNNVKWMDYVTTYKITPEDIKNAQLALNQQSTAQNKQNERYMNIAKTYSLVDPTTTLIKSPNAAINGLSWVQYMEKFKITNDDVTKAMAYAKGANKPNITDTSGKVSNTTGGGKTYGTPDPKVMEIQKKLKASGYDLGTSGPNKDGVDGVLGPKTRAAISGNKNVQQSPQQNIAISKDLKTKYNLDNPAEKDAYLKQALGNKNTFTTPTVTMSPEQQAIADKLKSGQPV